MLLLCALALLVPFALNLLASRDDYHRFVDGLFCSALLAAIWCVTTGLNALWDFPRSHDLHPLIDLIGLTMVVAAYMTQKQGWKLVLAFAFLGQLVAHVAFRSGYFGPRDYVGLLNVLWITQLLCVSFPGGGHVAVRALHLLRGDGRLPHLVRH